MANEKRQENILQIFHRVLSKEDYELVFAPVGVQWQAMLTLRTGESWTSSPPCPSKRLAESDVASQCLKYLESCGITTAAPNNNAPCITIQRTPLAALNELEQSAGGRKWRSCVSSEPKDGAYLISAQLEHLETKRVFYFNGNRPSLEKKNCKQKAALSLLFQASVIDETAQRLYTELTKDSVFNRNSCFISEEDREVEFKGEEGWNWPGECKKCIQETLGPVVCSFMNQHGGSLYYGIKNDGTVVGVKFGDDRNRDECLRVMNDILRPRNNGLYPEFLERNYCIIFHPIVGPNNDTEPDILMLPATINRLVLPADVSNYIYHLRQQIHDLHEEIARLRVRESTSPSYLPDLYVIEVRCLPAPVPVAWFKKIAYTRHDHTSTEMDLSVLVERIRQEYHSPSLSSSASAAW